MIARMKLSRRRALGLAAAGLGLAALEVTSLRGGFDHRSLRAASGAERYARSIAELDATREAADGAIVHVGHSTHVLSVAGARFLTDPWFFDPAFGALSHVQGPAVAPEAIGSLDALLVTHDHADHADLRAMDRLDKRATAIVATAELAQKARRLGFAQAIVLRAWESAVIGRARITAVPAQHDVYEVGYVVAGADRRVYFAGDTRLFDGMAEIAERARPTAAILPVDGTRVAFGQLHVMTPDDAVEAARRLGARLVVPTHAEAYFSDPLAERALASTVSGAVARFARGMSEALASVRCAVPASGELVRVPA